MVESARVIVGVNGSLSSLAALYRAVDLAREREALLVPLIAWNPTDRDSDRPVAELEHSARRHLDIAFEQAFGGYPEGLRIHPTVVRGEPGRCLVAAADRPDDLLVVGDSGLHRMSQLLHPSVSRYCRTHAGCPVETVSPSDLLKSLELTESSGAPLPFSASGHRPPQPHDGSIERS